jgi:hypothetical protein
MTPSGKVPGGFCLPAFEASSTRELSTYAQVPRPNHEFRTAFRRRKAAAVSDQQTLTDSFPERVQSNKLAEFARFLIFTSVATTSFDI